ncbi:MAG: sodium:alanine symporter family protein [Treponema sp.]|nr:sodium:alanine symporter family protein [Spirochaetia bacterium]MDD7460599.1 sodium:alanine symporter family protein [Spirochaetales bacterium]MDY5811166.1 sodium:alanine symporter family protein [Treponema sp.]
MFDKILTAIDDFVWGLPTIILILATGILLTVRLRCVQFTKLGRGFKQLFTKQEGGKGEVSPFAALCTALSATIGTGNIVGVATAIAAGGPGALFWMWLAALVGTATKYTECMLAVKYREHAADGHVLGGPFYTIERGMKERTGFTWKWLAVLFAIFGVCVGLFGIGTFTQINGITSAVSNAFDPESKNVAFALFGNNYTWSVVIAGALVTIAVALVVIGGLKRISKVAEKVVPAMAVVYVFLGLSIIIMNATKLPAAFAVIFKGAFGLQAMAGGAIGAVLKFGTDAAMKSMLAGMQKGVARGIFSNEAGLGSAPIAAAAAQVDEPVQQGIVSMLGTFIDTIIICTMTGLAIVIAFYTGNDALGSGELKGVALTAAAFNKVLGGDGHSVQFLLMICLVFFAFTTILGWDYYSEKCLEYLSKGNLTVVKVFRWVYILAVAIGPYFTISQVWTIADITNGLMAIPNCVSLIILSGVAARETKAYFEKFPKL